MSFRDANGNYIGGCGAQIGGLLLIPVMAIIITYIPIDKIMAIFIGLVFLVIIVGLILRLLGFPREKESEEERKEREKREEIYKRISKYAEEIDKKNKSQSN